MDINCNKVRLLAPITLNLEELIDKTDFNFLLRLSQKDISRRKAKGLPVSQKSKDYIAGFSEKKEKGKWLKPIRLKKLYWGITKIGNKRVNDPFCFDDYVKLPSGFQLRTEKKKWKSSSRIDPHLKRGVFPHVRR